MSEGSVGDEKDEEVELEEKEGEGQARHFADVGYVYSTFYLSHVFKACQASCTHTCSASRFTAAERKALALAKKQITEG